MDGCGAQMSPQSDRKSRYRLRWAIAIAIVVVLVLGSGVAYSIRSNLPAELRHSDVVGTWVRDDGGPGVAVFREDGTASIRGIPGGYPPTGQEKWTLSHFQGPAVSVTVGTTGFSFTSKWDDFRTVLVTYTGDPDEPSSANVFVRKNN